MSDLIPTDPNDSEDVAAPAASASPDDGPSGEGSSAGSRDESKFKGHRIRAGEFEGPLDLLLHLVRVNEVEITEIPIIAITDQYNEYLELMRELNLEVAGEYLVVASTLMHIKSRILLPVEVSPDDEEDDPRAELVQQLLEYQRFKQAAETLQAMDSRRGLIWTRRGIPEEFQDEELLTVDLFDLIKAFQGMLHRLGEEARIQLKKDNVSVADKIDWLREILDRRRSADFLELLIDLPNNLERIAAFLAILEMMRMQLLVAFQSERLGGIQIALRQADPTGDNGEAS